MITSQIVMMNPLWVVIRSDDVFSFNVYDDDLEESRERNQKVKEVVVKGEN